MGLILPIIGWGLLIVSDFLFVYFYNRNNTYKSFLIEATATVMQKKLTYPERKLGEVMKIAAETEIIRAGILLFLCVIAYYVWGIIVLFGLIIICIIGYQFSNRAKIAGTVFREILLSIIVGVTILGILEPFEDIHDYNLFIRVVLSLVVAFMQLYIGSIVGYQTWVRLTDITQNVRDIEDKARIKSRYYHG